MIFRRPLSWPIELNVLQRRNSWPCRCEFVARPRIWALVIVNSFVTRLGCEFVALSLVPYAEAASSQLCRRELLSQQIASWERGKLFYFNLFEHLNVNYYNYTFPLKVIPWGLLKNFITCPRIIYIAYHFSSIWIHQTNTHCLSWENFKRLYS